MRKILILFVCLIILAGIASLFFFNLNSFDSAQVVVQSQGSVFSFNVDQKACTLSTSSDTSCDVKRTSSWVRKLKSLEFSENSQPRTGPDLKHGYQVSMVIDKREIAFTLYPVDKIWFYMVKIIDGKTSAGYVKGTLEDLTLTPMDLLFLTDIRDLSIDTARYIVADKEYSMSSLQISELKRFLKDFHPTNSIFMGLPSSGDLLQLGVGLYRNENIQGYLVLTTNAVEKSLYLGRPHLTKPWVDYWLSGEKVVVRAEFADWRALTELMKKVQENDKK